MKDKQIHFNCPVEASLSLIGGKYKPLILWHLIDQPLHYMELQRLIPNATPKMLSSQLHDLEDCGMIHREVIPEKPPKTIYSLTPFGKSVIPILDALCQWGKNYLDGLDVKSPWLRLLPTYRNMAMILLMISMQHSIKHQTRPVLPENL